MNNRLGANFLKIAQDAATDAQSHVSDIERKLAEIEQEKLKLEAQRALARSALQRAANYPVTRGADYLCPLCWVDDSRESTLRPVPSSDRNDIFRCNGCHYEAIIPA